MDPGGRMKRVLMIAFHFPPFVGSSGVQRTLEFLRHLPNFGWQPGVVTVHPRAYQRVDFETLQKVPSGTPVWRAPAWDTARHLAVRGRYAGWMAVPDRWGSWIPFGVLTALRAVREFRPDVIWSTYPIASAHAIGSIVHRITKVPWVADFRDPMVQPEHGYPRVPLQRRVWARIERTCAVQASACVFVTEGAARTYENRFPGKIGTAVIENGYDEEAFRSVDGVAPAKAPPLCIVHSGALYPRERDPRPFFRALASWAASIGAKDLQVKFVFRGAGGEADYAAWAREAGVSALVRWCDPVPHRQAVSELAGAHGLLLLQGASCNDQIPAKAYEYLRTRRPILALTDPEGDTGRLLRKHPGVWLAPLEDEAKIVVALKEFLAHVARGPWTFERERLERYSREMRARELSELLSETVGTAAFAKRRNGAAGGRG
ncbi:glycosyltransferase [Deferrisoma palaeochoriense]